MAIKLFDPGRERINWRNGSDYPLSCDIPSICHTLKLHPSSMVRGLSDFVEKKCNWKLIHLSGDLVVDGYALCHELYRPNDGYGGDYVTFAKHVSKFLRCLKKNGIKPYVVFDGVDIDQTKRQTHEKRRKQNAERAYSLFQGQLHTLIDYLPYLARLAMIETVTNVLGEEQLYVADGDADAYIASIANERKCPVLSVDSDFYIFPISGGYIPYGRLDWEKDSVRARIYYYDEFAHQCGLQDPSLLVMIPAILGDNCIQSLRLIVKNTAEETVAAVVRYLSQFSTLDSCKTYEPHNTPEIQYNIHAACYIYCCRPHEGTRLKGGGYIGKEVPMFVVDQFRKGKWAKMLMDAICFGEVDHRVAIEDIKRPWCHLIGFPIREIIYGIIRGVYGVTEHHRVQGMANYFQDELIKTKIPSQLWPLTSGSGAILNPQYPSVIKTCGDEIILEAANCTVEIKKSITKREFWFFFLVSYYWYWNAKDDTVESGMRSIILGLKERKGDVLRAIILYAMRKILSIKYSTSHLPSLPNEPIPAVVHALSQWQSVYHDLLCLNQLLLEPLPPMQISQAFNCTTVVKFFEFITDHGDQKLICEMNLDDNCKKVYEDLFSLIVNPSIGTVAKK